MTTKRATLYVNDLRACHSSSRLEHAKIGYLADLAFHTLVTDRAAAIVFTSVADAHSYAADQGWVVSTSSTLGMVTAYAASV